MSSPRLLLSLHFEPSKGCTRQSQGPQVQENYLTHTPSGSLCHQGKLCLRDCLSLQGQPSQDADWQER
jgi:hypothetical protein